MYDPKNDGMFLKLYRVCNMLMWVLGKYFNVLQLLFTKRKSKNGIIDQIYYQKVRSPSDDGYWNKTFGPKIVYR